MKSSKVYALAALVAVLVIISFPSIRSVFLDTPSEDTVAQSAKPLSVITDKKIPSKPEDLEAKISKGVIELDWDKSSDNVGVIGYRVFRGASKDEVSFLATAPKASFIDDQFAASTKYYYRVTAYDAAGNESSRSKEASIKSPEVVVAPTTDPTTPDPKILWAVPMPPNSLQARGVSTSSLNLIWKHNTEQPVTPPYYKLYRNGVFVVDIPYIQTPIGVGIDSYFHRETGLTPGTTYTYLLKAVSAANYQSASSTSISVTTLPVPDVQAPIVSISSPINGATLSGTTTLFAVASDNIGVAGVRFTIDNIGFGQEITAAPYSTQWNTRSVSNGPHILRAIARDGAGNTTASAGVAITVTNSLLDPSKKPWQNFDLTKWKIQVTAKNPGPTDYYLKTISASEGEAISTWFRTDETDGSMRFWLDAFQTDQTKTALRSELREVMAETNNNLNWSAQIGTSTLSATIRVAPSPTFGGAQVTVLQIHPVSGKPLVRLVWYNVASANRQLKVHYKTDAFGEVDASVFCPNTNIGFNPFDAKISVINGRLTVQVGPVGGQLSTCLNNFQIHPDWVQGNYFKAGSYASQSWSGTGQVNIYKLEVYHSEPGILN